MRFKPEPLRSEVWSSATWAIVTALWNKTKELNEFKIKKASFLSFLSWSAEVFFKLFSEERFPPEDYHRKLEEKPKRLETLNPSQPKPSFRYYQQLLWLTGNMAARQLLTLAAHLNCPGTAHWLNFIVIIVNEEHYLRALLNKTYPTYFWRYFLASPAGVGVPRGQRPLVKELRHNIRFG